MSGRPVTIVSAARPRHATVSMVLLAAASLLAASPALAQQKGSLVLHVGEGRLIHLNADARNVFVGDAGVADVQVVTPREFYVYGRRPGETTLSATDTANGIAAQLRLSVDRSAAEAAASLPPGSAVSLSFLGNRLVLRGPIRNLDEAVDTDATAEAFNPSRGSPLDRTRLPGAQQITLRVRIAEVSRTTLDQLGINLNVIANPGNFAFGLVTGSFLGQSAANTLGRHR